MTRANINGFERQPYLVDLEVEVKARSHDGGRPYVVLDDTILYPGGGGQPADRGWIGATEVIDVQRVGDEIRHYVARPFEPAAARLRLDWERRFDHMQQHTAQHLITAIAADEMGWETTSFHLGAATSDIELDVPTLDDADLRRLEDAVVDRIRRALVVTTRRVDIAEYRSSEVRTRGLPEGHRGDVRLVEIAGVDCNTCGGTHVANTAEIETVVLLGGEPMRGGTRLHWVAGGRVRRLLHHREARFAAVRRLFETSDEELLEVAEGKLKRLRDAERRLEALQGDLARASADRLLSSTGPIMDAHFEDTDAAFLQRVARLLLASGDGRVALLTAASEGGAFFSLCASAEAAGDLRETGRRVAAILDGRGGGTPDLVQGKAGSLTRRDEVIAFLAELPPPAS